VPFPYHELSITQLPGEVSQGWPGLIYLATPAFLSASQVQFSSPFLQVVFQHLMLSHELGHQYWGQNVSWRSYREQWIMEALANYSALLFIDANDHGTAGNRSIETVLDEYRKDLLASNPAGIQQLKAGPVTLGSRLDSARFPNGYNVITYGRGTWLIHMLRSMLRDAAQLEGNSSNDVLFWQALRSLQTDFAGKAMAEHDLQAAFEKVWPRSIRYENSPSLDWFFHDWVNGVAIPSFQLQSVKISAAGTATGTIAMQEIPKDFTALVPLYAEMADGSHKLIAQVFADEAETTFKVKVPTGTKRLLLDPEKEILRRI
jgi:aminopeptidase N